MTSNSREATVGGIVVVGFLLILGFSYVGGKVTANVDTGSYLLKATFNLVDGLAEGGDVRLGGIKVGTVESFSLDEFYRAVALLRIDSEVKLPSDTSAAIHTDGLFGDKYIILEPGGDMENLPQGDEITFTQDSVIVGELLELIISRGKANRKKVKEQADKGAK